MKNKLIVLAIFTIFASSAFSQTIEKLYLEDNYQKLIKYEDDPNLTNEECFFVGYAFFILENDAKAIKMYDRAIKNGRDDDIIYLYKGLSYRYDDQYDKAKENFRLAINRNPLGQKNYTELANCFCFKEEYDSALVYFYIARDLEFELGDPYLKIPDIYYTMGEMDKALEEYYKSSEMIDKSDPVYIDLLKNIGFIEYTTTKNYSKSIKAFEDMISVDVTDYDLYPFLIKAYYANEDYEHGDSVFNILKLKYEKGKLSDYFNDKGGATVDQFYWNGQLVSVIKHFKTPTEFAESIYRFILTDKDGKKNVKMIMTEKTMGDFDGTKHLLCAKDLIDGTHFTYPIGWENDEIEYKELKEFVILILDGDLQPSASSNFGGGDKNDKKKNK